MLSENVARKSGIIGRLLWPVAAAFLVAIVAIEVDSLSVKLT